MHKFAISVVVLIGLFAVAFACSPRVQPTMTDEERTYWETVEMINNEGIRVIEEEIPDQIDSISDISVRKAKFPELLESWAQQPLDQLRQLPPPPLFQTYHQRVIETWIGLDELARFIANEIRIVELTLPALEELLTELET